MTSNTTPDHDPVELGELERDILSIVWRMGNVTAEQVREELDRPLKDSTVRTVFGAWKRKATWRIPSKIGRSSTSRRNRGNG